MDSAPKNRKRFWWRLAIFSAIGLGVLAIVVPNFVMCGPRPAALRNACINNLRQIEGAKEQWAVDHEAKAGAAVAEADIAAYIKGGMPRCPKGGKYTVGKLGETPRCTIADHTIVSQ